MKSCCVYWRGKMKLLTCIVYSTHVRVSKGVITLATFTGQYRWGKGREEVLPRRDA